VTHVEPDSYGNVSNSIEAVLTSSKDFPKWLKQHNKRRKSEGNSEEDADEFDLEEYTVETFKK
jgi:hypothetical protein